jgi:MFS superfamily sulfate permease-like transporter
VRSASATLRLQEALTAVPRTAAVYRNIKQYPTAEETPQICVVRVDAPLYFANVEWVSERIRKYAARNNNEEKHGPVRFVVIDMSPMSYVDATGAERPSCMLSKKCSECGVLVRARAARPVPCSPDIQQTHCSCIIPGAHRCDWGCAQRVLLCCCCCTLRRRWVDKKCRHAGAEGAGRPIEEGRSAARAGQPVARGPGTAC